MTNDPPIYFSSLELQNVRCFGERQRLKLTDSDGNPVQWILILGDNGVGKTTLLQCLAWMRPVPWAETEAGGIQGTEPALNDEENEVWDSLIRMGDDVDVILEATLSIGRNLGSNSAEGATNLTTHVEMHGEKGLLKERKDTGRDVNFFVSPYSALRDADLAMFGYGATRRPGTLTRDAEELSDPLASLFRDSAELYDAEDILLKLDHGATSGTDQDKRVLSDVKRLLAEVLPDVADATQIEIRPPRVFGSRRQHEGVTVETPYGNVPVSALSLGYQTTLTWVTDLALRMYDRYPESSNPLAEPGIVLIDNIDLHLHPRWQRRMMTDVAQLFPAVQFIATAHSPLIVQAAENAKLVVLRESDGEVVIDDDHDVVNTWRVDQILSSELFGVPVRSEYVEDLRKRRNSLADLPHRSERQENELQCLREKLDKLPTAEDPEDRAALDLIREIASDLRKSRSPGS